MKAVLVILSFILAAAQSMAATQTTANSTSTLVDCKGLVKNLRLGVGGPFYPAMDEFPAHIILKKTLTSNGSTQVSAEMSGIMGRRVLKGTMNSTSSHRALIDSNTIAVMEFKGPNVPGEAMERVLGRFDKKTQTFSYINNFESPKGSGSYEAAYGPARWTVTCGDMKQ